jgi:hypothetical protein
VLYYPCVRGCLESVKQVIFILGNREQGTGNREEGGGSREWGIGNGEWGMGNGEWGTHKKQ